MQDGTAQTSAAMTLLTCPTYHAMISAVSEGNVDVMRININNVSPQTGEYAWQ